MGSGNQLLFIRAEASVAWEVQFSVLAFIQSVIGVMIELKSQMKQR